MLLNLTSRPQHLRRHPSVVVSDVEVAGVVEAADLVVELPVSDMEDTSVVGVMAASDF